VVESNARGTARPYTRRDVPQPSWDRLRQLPKDIQAVQAELDRALDLLEEEGAAIQLMPTGPRRRPLPGGARLATDAIHGDRHYSLSPGLN
jgi:hypothetical protein